MGSLDPNRRERSMEKGHPYLTDELDALRADQRRLLRELPDNLVSDGELTTPVDLTDRERLEVLVRKYIASIIRGKPDLKTTADTISVWQEGEDLHRSLLDGPQSQEPGHPYSTALAELLQPLEAQQTEALKNYLAIPEEKSNRLAPLVVLLRWAEAYADDDYEEPRLEGPGGEAS
jgi:hypothetical protein